MPRVIELADARSCGLDEAAAGITAAGFDPGNEASLLNAAGRLRRLGNNDHFLGDLLVESWPCATATNDREATTDRK